jgi:hypothetical protein
MPPADPNLLGQKYSIDSLHQTINHQLIQKNNSLSYEKKPLEMKEKKNETKTVIITTKKL